MFFGKSALAVLGMALWGINMGAQDTLLKAAIAPLIAAGRRTTAFGLFDTSFGAAWLLGSVAFGLLYGKSLPLLVVVSVVGQLVQPIRGGPAAAFAVWGLRHFVGLRRTSP